MARPPIDTTLPKIESSSFEALNANLKRIKEENKQVINSSFRPGQGSYSASQQSFEPTVAPNLAEMSSQTDRMMTHTVLSLQKATFNKVLHQLINDLTVSLNRSDLAANLCLFSYLINRTLDFEILARATPFTSLTVHHDWMRLMPPIDELLNLINQFLMNRPALERVNFEWLWKTNSRLLAKLLGTAHHAMLPLVSSGVEDMSSRRLIGICHIFTSYFQNIKMCLHVQNLMSPDESDIFLKPSTLEMAEAFIEVTLRMMFLYKQSTRPTIRHQTHSGHVAKTVPVAPAAIPQVIEPIISSGNGSATFGTEQLVPPTSSFTKNGEIRQERQPCSPTDSDRRVPSIFAENKTVYTLDTAPTENNYPQGDPSRRQGVPAKGQNAAQGQNCPPGFTSHRVFQP